MSLFLNFIPKIISTSKLSVKHLFTGQNTQHAGTVYYYCHEKCQLHLWIWIRNYPLKICHVCPHANIYNSWTLKEGSLTTWRGEVRMGHSPTWAQHCQPTPSPWTCYSIYNVVVQIYKVLIFLFPKSSVSCWRIFKE